MVEREQVAAERRELTDVPGVFVLRRFRKRDGTVVEVRLDRRIGAMLRVIVPD